jgi:Outer membrane receptor proteins, mostly Fe transport
MPLSTPAAGEMVIHSVHSRRVSALLAITPLQQTIGQGLGGEDTSPFDDLRRGLYTTVCMRTLFLTLVPVLLVARPEGVVQGFVYDAVSGEPLPGANVYVDSLKRGAAADLDGFYRFELPPGRHYVQASILGYQTKGEWVVVEEGKPARMDFYLPEEAIKVEAVEVTAQQEIAPEQTATVRQIDTEELENLPSTQNTADVLGQLAGVQRVDQEINIRGGRGNEVALLVEGISLRDPLSGSAFGIRVPLAALREMEAMIGGFNAEYGEAMSGVVRLEIREGRDRFHVTGHYRTDSPGLWRYKTHHILEGTAEGPLFFWRKPVPTYFFTLRLEGNNTYLPYTTNLRSSVLNATFPFAENALSSMLKLAWEPKKGLKATFSHAYSVEVSQGYEYSRYDYPFAYRFPYRYMYHLDHYPVFTREGVHSVLTISYLPSTKHLFMVRLSRFYTKLHLDVQGKHWRDYQPLDDVEDQIGDPARTGPGDGFFWDRGDAPYWHDHDAETYTFKGDYTWTMSAIHQIKTGLQVDQMNLQWIDIQYPWFYDPEGLGLNHDIFQVWSFRGGWYVQDRIHFAGMIANVGLRLDGWAPGRYLDDAVKRMLQDPTLHPIVRKEYVTYLNETPKLGPYRVRLYLSPRFGVSYPVTERDKFYFSYGRFSQLPDLKYVYAHLGDRTTSSYELFGNPNLRPTVTIAYETGVQHAFSGTASMTFNAYFKDIFNYPTAVKVAGIPPNPDFFMYFNSDYARSLGLELSLRQRANPHLSYQVEITWSQTKGKASTSEDALFRPQEYKLKEWYLRWDRPWKLYARVGYRVLEGEHPFGIFPDNMYFGASASWISGRRYTPVDSLGNRGEINSRLGPAWKRVDITVSKDFRFSKLPLRLRLEVNNLFDWKNPYYVNPLTGRAYEPGDPIPPRSREIYYLNPARYREGRSVYLDLSMRM